MMDPEEQRARQIQSGSKCPSLGRTARTSCSRCGSAENCRQATHALRWENVGANDTLKAKV